MTRRPNLEAREKILEAALHLFHERGYRGTSMDDVARAAGVKKPNLFHYYPSKDELAAAVLVCATERQKALIEQRLPLDACPFDAIDAMFSEAKDRMSESACCRGCLIGNLAQEVSDLNPRLRAQISSHFQFWTGRIAEVFRRSQGRGKLKRALDPERTARSILALFEGATLIAKAHKDVGALEDARRTAEEYLRSMQGKG